MAVDRGIEGVVADAVGSALYRGLEQPIARVACVATPFRACVVVVRTTRRVDGQVLEVRSKVPDGVAGEIRFQPCTDFRCGAAPNRLHRFSDSPILSRRRSACRLNIAGAFEDQSEVVPRQPFDATHPVGFSPETVARVLDPARENVGPVFLRCTNHPQWQSFILGDGQVLEQQVATRALPSAERVVVDQGSIDVDKVVVPHADDQLARVLLQRRHRPVAVHEGSAQALEFRLNSHDVLP